MNKNRKITWLLVCILVAALFLPFAINPVLANNIQDSDDGTGSSITTEEQETLPAPEASTEITEDEVTTATEDETDSTEDTVTATETDPDDTAEPDNLEPVVEDEIVLSGKDVTDSVTVKNIKLFYRDGTTEITNGSQIAPDTEISIRYEFDVAEDVIGNDYIIFTMPREIILFLDDVSETRIPVPLDDNPDVIIAYVILQSGSSDITIIFEDIIEQYDDVYNAFFSIDAVFDEDLIAGSKNKKLEFSAGGTTIEIELNFSTIQLEIEKTLADQSDEDNEHYQTWEVKVNDGKYTIHDAVIADQLPDGTSLESFQFEGYELNELPDGWTADITGRLITFSCEDAISDTVTIYITTKVTDLTSIKSTDGLFYLNNQAAFYGSDSYENDLGFVTDEADTTFAVRWFFKDGEFVESTDSYIDWILIINPEKQSISNVVLIDYLPPGVELLSDTIHIHPTDDPGAPLTIAEAGSPQAAGADATYTIVSDLDNVVLTVYLPDLNDTYTLTYSTTVTNDIHNSADTYSNKASLTWDWNGTGYTNHETASVDVYYRLLSKFSQWYAPYRQRGRWSISVNESKRPIEGVVKITDTFDPEDRLLFIENTQEVILDGNTLVAGDDYEIEVSADRRSFEITFPTNSFNGKTARIYLETELTDFDFLSQNNSIQRVYNRAAMYEDNLPIANVEANTIAPASILEKKLNTTKGDIFEWEITVNRYGLTGLGKSILTDTLPEFMTLYEVEMYKGKINLATLAVNDTMSRGEQLPAVLGEAYTYDDKGKSVTFTFDDGFLDNQPVIIVLRTQLSEEFFQTARNNYSLINQATLICEHVEKTASASASGKASSTPLIKAGSYNKEDGSIHWEVTVNSDGRDWEFDYAVLTDQLQDGLVLDVSSVELKQYVVADDGSIEQETTVEFDKNTCIDYDINTNHFTFTFPDVDRGYAYKLLFATDVIKSGSYNNSITLKGVLPDDESCESGIGIQVSDSSAGANANRKAQITLLKTDQFENSLAGVVFELRDATGNLLETQTTDSDGTIAFKSWLKRETDYFLHETKTLDGYDLLEDPIKVHIESDAGPQNPATLSYTAKNVRKEKITLLKTNEDDSLKLEGAVFELRDKDGNILETQTSDEKGMIEFETWLHYETFYYLYETKAPSGYNRLSTPLTVFIESNSDGTVKKETLLYTAKNIKSRNPGGNGGGTTESPDPGNPGVPGTETPDPGNTGEPGTETPTTEDPGTDTATEIPGTENPDNTTVRDPDTTEGISIDENRELNPKTGYPTFNFAAVLFILGWIGFILIAILLYRKNQR